MSNKNEMREKISVVVPCYNEEAALPYFFSEIRKVADKMSADDSLLFFVFRDAEDYHITGSIPGDIDRLAGLAAKIGNFIGIVSQIRDRADHWHKRHLLLSISIAKL